jgi:hypothetical protein
MKKLTLAEARKEIADRELWLYRQRHWGRGRREELNVLGDERDFCDVDYPGPGLEDLFWEVPNQ